MDSASYNETMSCDGATGRDFHHFTLRSDWEQLGEEIAAQNKNWISIHRVDKVSKMCGKGFTHSFATQTLLLAYVRIIVLRGLFAFVLRLGVAFLFQRIIRMHGDFIYFLYKKYKQNEVNMGVHFLAACQNYLDVKLASLLFAIVIRRLLAATIRC